MESRGDGSVWFNEESTFWPGQAFSLRVKKILLEKESKYQKVLVFESETWGRVLVLDGAIQLTDRDEFAYHEMMAHLPMMSHPNPKDVLIIGGGDGGVVREVIKHKSVEHVVLCDIDEEVVNVGNEYFPAVSCGYKDPRVTVHIGDGFEFLKNHVNEFDVIVTDSTDPIGPAESLFTQEYYSMIADALRDDGIMCCQGESMYLHLDLIKDVMERVRKFLPKCEYAWTHIPTYPCGSIGCLLATKNSKIDLKNPARDDAPSNCKYYSREIHSSSYVLPAFAAEKLH